MVTMNVIINAEISRCRNTRAVEKKFTRFEVIPPNSAGGVTFQMAAVPFRQKEARGNNQDG